SNYEQRINTLQRRIKELESGNGGSDGDSARVRDLENQLEEKVKINQQQEMKIEKLERDFEKLNENYRQQQEVMLCLNVNASLQEASKLLEEIKSLSIKNDDLYSEKEQSIAKIKSLSEEVNDWKSKYEKVKTELRNLKATSSFYKETPKIDIMNDNSLSPTQDGAIDESKIVAYQVAIDDLLRAGRSEVSSNVLVAMKSIVIACKGITEEVDAYEQRRNSSMKAEDKEKLNTLKSKFSATLQQLMTAAKNHATGYGVSPVSLLDAAASHLNASVVEMVKHVKLRRTRGQDANKPSSEYTPLPPSENMSNASPSQDDLNSSNTGPKSDLNVEKSNGYAIGVDELKDFLERQTESIVQSIQTLLTAIRSGSFGKELTDNINTITTIVLNVIAVCRDSFRSNNIPQSVRGNVIVKELEESIDKLDEMRESITDNRDDFLNNRAAKQRLASASFEIAKFTKELLIFFFAYHRLLGIPSLSSIVLDYLSKKSLPHVNHDVSSRSINPLERSTIKDTQSQQSQSQNTPQKSSSKPEICDNSQLYSSMQAALLNLIDSNNSWNLLHASRSSDVKTTFDFLADVKRRPEWDHLMQEGKLIEIIDENTTIQYIRMKAAFPVSSRDVVTLNHVVKLNDGRMMMTCKSIEYKSCPKIPGVIRLDCDCAGFIVAPINDQPNKCFVTQIANADPKGWIPKSILKLVSTRDMPASAKKLNILLTKMPRKDPNFFSSSFTPSLTPSLTPKTQSPIVSHIHERNIPDSDIPIITESPTKCEKRVRFLEQSLPSSETGNSIVKHPINSTSKSTLWKSFVETICFIGKYITKKKSITSGLVIASTIFAFLALIRVKQLRNRNLI
ncbi:5531_t:CDS:10, partial [Dentiscutata erythropus]